MILDSHNTRSRGEGFKSSASRTVNRSLRTLASIRFTHPSSPFDGVSHRHSDINTRGMLAPTLVGSRYSVTPILVRKRIFAESEEQTTSFEYTAFVHKSLRGVIRTRLEYTADEDSNANEIDQSKLRSKAGNRSMVELVDSRRRIASPRP